MSVDDNSVVDYYDVVIVGAGPAGIGMGILLQKLRINYIILEKNSIGASFNKWPKETRFISPSFTGNFFNMPDLNSVSPETSPAFDLLTEHPTGDDYAYYLKRVSKHYQLDIQLKIEVLNIEDKDGSFLINTNHGTYASLIVIWAAGEYQYPKTKSFEGEHLCTHYSEISSFSELPGTESLVIGGYESGFDVAINLSKQGKKITLFDDFHYLDLVKSDSSYSLSPFTRDRLNKVLDNVDYHDDTKVEKVEFIDNEYIVTTSDEKVFKSSTKPINCTGFDTSLKLVSELFDFDGGYPLLTEWDESRKTENLFLVGPQVKHGNALFCFIYKYRQRFAVVAEEIARRSEIPPNRIRGVVDEYKSKNFYLKDLSCCDDECVC